MPPQCEQDFMIHTDMGIEDVIKLFRGLGLRLSFKPIINEGDNMEEQNTKSEKESLSTMNYQGSAQPKPATDPNKYDSEYLRNVLNETSERNERLREENNHQRDLLLASAIYKDAANAAINYAERAFDLQRQLNNANNTIEYLKLDKKDLHRENKGLSNDVRQAEKQCAYLENERIKDTERYNALHNQVSVYNEKLEAQIKVLRSNARKKAGKK